MRQTSLSVAMFAAGYALIGVYVLLLGSSIGVLWYTFGPPAVPRIAVRRLRDARRARSERREARLENAGVARTRMDELTALVDRSRQLAPDAVERWELDDLLDLYADASIAARNAETMLVRCYTLDHRPLSQIVGRHREAWRTRSANYGEYRDEVASLIQLYVARATMPEIEPLLDPDGIDRRLAVLDRSPIP